MKNIENMKQMAQNLARALHATNESYNDYQITSTRKTNFLQNEDEDANEMEELSNKEIAIRNVIFGLRGVSNFTQNKTAADQLLYNFLNAFNSNYVVDDSELPEGLTSETRIIFTVRFIEAILNLLKEDLSNEQSQLALQLIQFGLDILVNTANNL